MYDIHLGLIGKRVVNFLLVLIELFSLGVTVEPLRANIGSKSAISLQLGPFDPKFHVERVAPHQPLPDRRTDGQTVLIARPRLHSMQRGKSIDYNTVSTLE